MTKDSVFCLSSSHEQVERIVSNLKNSNSPNNDISVLIPHHKLECDHEVGTTSTKCLLVGTGTGVVLGGSLGWIAGMGAITIPGIGPLIGAGPLIAALIGGTVGGIAGELIGMCVSENNANRYEEKIKEGNILISVHAERLEEIIRAKKIFMSAGAQEICTSGEIKTHNR